MKLEFGTGVRRDVVDYSTTMDVIDAHRRFPASLWEEKQESTIRESDFKLFS